MKATRIIVHHSLTSDSSTVSWGAIRKYHIEKLGWTDIGYHAGVELLKENYEVLMGRSWDRQGAHCRGHNGDSLGICFIGDYNEEEPEEQMLIVGARVVRLWMRLFGIPVERVFTHHYFAPHKTCPGREFGFNKFREML